MKTTDLTGKGMSQHDSGLDNTLVPRDNSGLSRRGFLKASALAGSGAVLGGASITSLASTASTLPLKVTGYRFDRLQALMDGKVKIAGCDASFQVGKIGDMNTDVFSGPQTFDVTEIGLHPYMLAYANEGFRDYTLLPVFPLRLFRHKSVFINTDSGIGKPQDIIGKRIGTAGYSSTSLTWLRGIFQDEYGVKPGDVEWVVAAGDSSAGTAGKLSKQESVRPEGISIVNGSPGKDESELLVSGEVDVLFHAAEPKAFTQGHPKIRRLFADSRATEQAYFQKTGIFPIMHTVAIRSSLLKREPWLAKSVFDAYVEAKNINYQYMAKLGWAMNALPWFGQELEQTQVLMGKNFYSYGIDNNRKTLETLFRYSYQQGLSRSELKIEQLFAAESLELLDP